MSQTIYLGADHAGFALKEQIKKELGTASENVTDLGAAAFKPDDDYPAIARAVVEAVARDSNGLGILVCGNGIGVCITANKTRGIRAGIGYSIEAAKTMRADTDANVLCLPGRLPVLDDPLKIVKAFLQTEPSNEERHRRRIAMIE